MCRERKVREDRNGLIACWFLCALCGLCVVVRSQGSSKSPDAGLDCLPMGRDGQDLLKDRFLRRGYRQRALSRLRMQNGDSKPAPHLTIDSECIWERQEHARHDIEGDPMSIGTRFP